MAGSFLEGGAGVSFFGRGTNQIADFRNTKRKAYLHKNVNILIQSAVAKCISLWYQTDERTYFSTVEWGTAFSTAVNLSSTTDMKTYTHWVLKHQRTMLFNILESSRECTTWSEGCLPVANKYRQDQAKYWPLVPVPFSSSHSTVLWAKGLWNVNTN